ncbi:MAG: glyoxalase [Acidimicrobiaceae bacterium]|nr:glyoxalase [Acidimicrobiaceae bacterium]
MKLGAFSVSLAVQDLDASRAFYERLGFEQTGGDADAGWLIMMNGTTILGLFQGMFDENILTFNPGLTQSAESTDDFTDVREIQAALAAAGVEVVESTDPDGTGPAHIVIVDPDGNRIMVDQFVDRPDT